MNSALALSQQIEALLVANNPRQMAEARKHLVPGYYLRAAQQLINASGTILIGTGFPVGDTFETDGPIGAIALYHCLRALGKNPIIVCGNPLFEKIRQDFLSFEIPIETQTDFDVSVVLKQLSPSAIVSIERPGVTLDGTYRNMAGIDISARCACFDSFMDLANCPTIAIGDGGNEIGMGNLFEQLLTFDVVPSVTKCDELLVSDVSNWGAYGVIAMMSYLTTRNYLAEISPTAVVNYLSDRGSVDGISKLNTLTEDGFCVSHSENLLEQMQIMCGFNTEVARELGIS